MVKCAIRAYKVRSNRTSLAFHTENKRPMWRVHRYGIALQPAGLEAFYVTKKTATLCKRAGVIDREQAHSNKISQSSKNS